MQNFDDMIRGGISSTPAMNVRLRSFNTQLEPLFFKKVNTPTEDAAAAFPFMAKPKRQGNANAIAPQPRLSPVSSFNYNTGAPSTLIATQQAQRGGNSGLFAMMGVKS